MEIPNSLYIFTDSHQSNYLFGNNTGSSFTVQLLGDISLTPGEWECGLKQLRIQRASDVTGFFLINSDIVGFTSAYGDPHNILRSFDIPQQSKQAITTDVWEYNDVYYMPVIRKNISSIHFDIWGVGRNIQPPIQRVWCVLHFRKKKN